MDAIYSDKTFAASEKDLRFRQARSADPKLSALGQEQVRNLSQHPALEDIFGSDVNVEILSSPLTRAIETAHPIQKIFPRSPIRLMPSLVEGGGLYQTSFDGTNTGMPGRNRAEFQNEFPHITLDLSMISDEGWWDASVGKEQEGGVDCAFWQRVERVAAWMREYCPPPQTRHVFVVGHGALFDRLISELLGVGRTAVAFTHVNTGVTHIEMHEGLSRVHCINSPPATRTSNGTASVL
ncbi:hypothetical protein CYMTET_36532 [Cymbomonas tetramitiformis]|uniref:Phosphoglycerate mutase n=1 Tax=Cymbomonas tetramitiformis TaxID=36881 RepID=A0AAE0CHA8_9CHLO|nr:hypothetical protein CYMTET_36532 [Cymbomonas tetramitiformis]